MIAPDRRTVADLSQNRRRNLAEVIAESRTCDKPETAASRHKLAPASRLRLAPATPTDGRTDGLTKNLLTSRKYISPFVTRARKADV